MKRPFRWVLWLAVAGLVVGPVVGEFMVLSGPQFNYGPWYSNTNRQAKQVFCITNDTSSALIWNTYFEWDSAMVMPNDVENKSAVINSEFYVYSNDDLTCQMSQYSSCSQSWKYEGNWKHTTNTENPMSPVFDNRWEDFQVETISESFRHVTRLQISGALSVSIRGSTDAHFAICNQYNIQNFCFFIILGGWKNTLSVLRKCENGIPDPITQWPSDDCRFVIDSHNASILSPREWQTFTLKWNFQNKIVLSVYSTQKRILHYEMPNKKNYFTGRYEYGAPYTSYYYLFVRGKNKMKMKFHKYSYSMTTTTQSTLISPQFMATPPGKTVCLEMSISLCRSCMMTVDFIDQNGTYRSGKIFRNTVKNNLYDLPTWQNEKINETLSSKLQEPVMLKINTLYSDDTTRNSTYWAISNIRRCFDGAIRVVPFEDYQDYSNYDYVWQKNITCQKISADGTSTIIHLNDFKKSTIDPGKRPPCPEGKIGSSCSVTCSILFRSHGDCNKLVACDVYGCSCAQGFTEDVPKCDNYCSKTYGYDCKQKCGNCARNSCHFATGRCNGGCENTISNYYLPPNCKEGIGSPPIPNVEHINSTLVRLFLDMKNEYKNIPTIIHFEVWENSVAVFKSKNLTINSNTVIEAFSEQLLPGTHYNFAGFVHAVNRTFQSEWGTFTTTCTESIDFNFVTIPDENNITINNQIHDLFKDPCPYTWYRVQLYSGSNLLFHESTSFPKTLTNLDSYTRYKVVIKSEKSIIVDRIVQTLEGAPSEVKNLQAVPSFSDIIVCTWEAPETPNGKIVNYTVQVEPNRSLGCNDLKKLSYSSVPGYNASEFKKQSVIMNTNQTSYRLLFNELKPYTEYLITVYACTSRHCGRKTERLLQTLPLDYPTEVFSNLHITNETSTTVAAKLRWDSPSDCSSITGTIKAAKLYIKKLSDVNSFSEETNNYYYDLKKLDFEGTENYEVRLHTLRSNGVENETAYVSLKFRMPAREPPPILDFDVVEVDAQSQETMLRWKVPNLPHHGKLDHYSISFCGKNSTVCDEKHRIIVNISEYCTLWNTKNMICKTITLPSRTYYQYKITAYNEGVIKPSTPVFMPVKRSEFEPSKPTDLLLNILNQEKALVNVVWNQPLKTGGRLSKFEIKVYLITSNLKIKPWQYKYYAINDTYHPEYIKLVDLLPSSYFEIVVRAVTIGGIFGSEIEKQINLPNAVSFNSTNLTPKTNDDQMISISIPTVINDINGSVMVILVQGLKYCDTKNDNNKDNVFLDSLESKYNLTWEAAILTNPEKYANNEFKVGDGEIYGGVKNYRLCSKQTYIVRIVLIEEYKNSKNIYFKSSDPNILAELKSNEVFIGEPPEHYAMWMTPLFLIAIITTLLIFIYYRKHMCLLTSTPKTRPQENMPLSNDFNTSKSNNIMNEVETDSKKIDEKEVSQNNIFIVAKKTEYMMPIKVQEFGNYFEYAFKSGTLNKEYKTIKSGLTRPYTYGSQPETKPKNRYANLFPYDDTRVVLEKLPDDPFSDYINANFITGYGEIPKAYIATQGPKPNTVIDFWRMVWQEKVKIICMMANLMENGKTKCEQYWPSAIGKKVLYGTISVKFASEEVHSDYTYRTFQVSNSTQEIRTIEHLHYTAWPDHGVPSNPRSIVAFLQEIQRHAPAPRKSGPPIIVHCSAGVGRTGTLIVLDMAVCRIFSEQVIDVYANVLSVRKERLNMVDNTEQYLLVHLVLVEFLNSKDTCFTCDNTLPEKIREAKKFSTDHYQRILDTSWWNEVLGSPPLPEKSVSIKNRAKHRFPESAGGLNRIYLKRLNRYDEDSDYIAATCVTGIFNNCQYITTQLPMPSTASDFWRMLTELNVELVLVLQLPDLQDNTYCELVPESQSYGNSKYLKIIRQENSTVDSQLFQQEEVLIIDSSEQPSKEQTVKIVSYKNWPEASLPPPNELVSLWKTFDKFPNKDNCPIVIVCRDGVTASGLWLTLSILLKRMAIDKECDVLQAVRSIKGCRKDFLNRTEYFNYLYEVALECFTQT